MKRAVLILFIGLSCFILKAAGSNVDWSDDTIAVTGTASTITWTDDDGTGFYSKSVMIRHVSGDNVYFDFDGTATTTAPSMVLTTGQTITDDVSRLTVSVVSSGTTTIRVHAIGEKQ